MRNPGLGQGRQRLVVAPGCQEREIRLCSSPEERSDVREPLNLRDPKIFEMLPSPSLICHPAVSSHSQTWVSTNAGNPPVGRLP